MLANLILLGVAIGLSLIQRALLQEPSFPTLYAPERQARALPSPERVTSYFGNNTNGLNPSFHLILEEYRELTGIGTVVNIFFFSMHEEPMVSSLEDAMRSFLQGHLANYPTISPFISLRRDS